MLRTVSIVARYWDLIQFKAACDLKAESSRAYLGALWWYLEPLLYLSVFYLIRGVLFTRSGEDLVGMLLTGIVFWRWFDSSLRRSANSVIANTRIATQAYLPKIVFPLIALSAMGRRFAIILAIYLAYILFRDDGLPATWPYFLVLLFVQFVLILGISLFLSAIVPFLPDLNIIISNGLTLLFFASGIFFDISELEPATQKILYLNPMAYLINSYRDVLLMGQLPQWSGLLYTFSFGVVFLIAGCKIYQRYDMTYPKVLSSM